MKVLVDTSVWSLALRRKSPDTAPQVSHLQNLIEADQPIFLAGVILMEILQGIRNREQSVKIQRYLEAFPMLDLSRAGYLGAALLGSHCRSNGVQCNIVDILIAQIAITHGCHLLTADQDFVRIAKHTELKLV